MPRLWQSFGFGLAEIDGGSEDDRTGGVRRQEAEAARFDQAEDGRRAGCKEAAVGTGRENGAVVGHEAGAEGHELKCKG